MAEKSALPTPTIMMDMGSLEALTMALMVSAMSDITPSVNISRMKYCCKTNNNCHLDKNSCTHTEHVITYNIHKQNTCTNLMLLIGCCMLCKPCYMVNNRGKVGGTPQLDRLQGCVVGLYNSRYTSTVWILRISI